MFKRILVPVDGSRHADRAVEAAATLAKEQDAAILLLHVIRTWALPREIMEMIRAGEITESRQEIMENSARIILEIAAKKLAAAGVPAVSAEYITGDPAAEIADYAERHAADLIVIGHRGLGAERAMLGSMARNLLNLARVSCLVVR